MITNLLNPKFSEEVLESLKQNLTVKPGNSNILDILENTTETSLTELFNQDTTSLVSVNNPFINSPLESGESIMKLFNDLNFILGSNLIVNLVIIYLICMLIFTFTTLLFN